MKYKTLKTLFITQLLIPSSSRRVLTFSLRCALRGSVSVGGRLQTVRDSQTLFVATTLSAILFVTPLRKW